MLPHARITSYIQPFFLPTPISPSSHTYFFPLITHWDTVAISVTVLVLDGVVTNTVVDVFVAQVVIGYAT